MTGQQTGAAMPVSDAFLTAGLKITGHFEDSEDPLGAVSGNFDQMGISLGVLQWNIGSNSLQPIIRAIGKAPVCAVMPTRGEDLWRACNATVAEGLRIVRAWQPNNRMPPAVLAELKALVRCADFQAKQMQVARKVGDTAWAAAVNWANKFGRNTATKREYCWFYDIFTQNGGLKSVTPKKVQDFIAGHGADRADDIVCDWLAARKDAQPGAKDSRKNATLWRNKVADGHAELFVASYLRAGESNPLWQADVLNRKGTIALGKGWVHASQHDVTPITG
jgi:hypothetical protein